MYTKADILNIAKRLLSLDYNCQISDFEIKGNTLTNNKIVEGSRDERNGCFLKILIIGGKVIISGDEQLRSWLEEKIQKLNPNWLFDYGILRMIDHKLREFGHEIAEMPHFYLPKPMDYDIKPITRIKWFEEEDILQFKDDNRFEEAFVFDENYPDVLGVATYEGDNIIGMAGASQDTNELYQVGIDVLPDYNGKGIGTNLITLLKQELIKRGKIPFYGTSLSHIISRNVAINAGFFPVWVELYSRKIRNKL